jgi:hypothetical protein
MKKFDGHETNQLQHAAHSRVARLAIGASTVRGKKSKGVIPNSRRFLRSIRLQSFGVSDGAAFRRVLDRTTHRLARKLPKHSRQWGLARKVLNIFLRDCLYNFYLRRAHSLHLAERFLELPLDSITARQVRQDTRRKKPAAWPGVRRLPKTLSDEYQNAAQEIARKMGMARVHLDALWWSVGRDD